MSDDKRLTYGAFAPFGREFEGLESLVFDPLTLQFSSSIEDKELSGLGISRWGRRFIEVFYEGTKIGVIQYDPQNDCGLIYSEGTNSPIGRYMLRNRAHDFIISEDPYVQAKHITERKGKVIHPIQYLIEQTRKIIEEELSMGTVNGVPVAKYDPLTQRFKLFSDLTGQHYVGSITTHLKSKRQVNLHKKSGKVHSGKIKYDLASQQGEIFAELKSGQTSLGTFEQVNCGYLIKPHEGYGEVHTHPLSFLIQHSDFS